MEILLQYFQNIADICDSEDEPLIFSQLEVESLK